MEGNVRLEEWYTGKARLFRRLGEEKLRVKYKVYDKTSKFTIEDITLVALNCTSSPELEGDDEYSVIKEVLHEAYTGLNLQGTPTGFGNHKVDKTIKKCVDGVIWFELFHGNGLMP